MKLDFKLKLTAKQMVNKKESDDGDEAKTIFLADELNVKKNFCCSLCKSIPIAPVVQCKSCEVLYCGTQCYERMKLLNQEEG